MLLPARPVVPRMSRVCTTHAGVPSAAEDTRRAGVRVRVWRLFRVDLLC